MGLTRVNKYLIIAVWLVTMAVAAPLAGRLGDVIDNDALHALPGGSESSRAAARLVEAFPRSDALSAVVVYARDTGLNQADQARIEADRSELLRYARSGGIGRPETSADGKAALYAFQLAGDADAQSAATGKIKELVESSARDGLATALTGTAGAEKDVSDAFSGMDGMLLAVTGIAVAVLLLLMYRSPVLWLVPILVTGAASELAMAVVYLLAKHTGLAVDFQSQSILTVLVFGVGVDYALLLISRYREQLRTTADRHTAMTAALRRTAGTLCASASAVALGLLCLLAADLPATRGLGPIGVIGILVTLVAMTTMLPAVLVLCGRWIFWPMVPRYVPESGSGAAGLAEVGATGSTAAGSGSTGSATGGTVADGQNGEHGVWARVAALVGRRPRLVWAVTAAALVAMSFGMTNLSIGLPNSEAFTTEVGSVRGQAMIAEHFAGGTVSPVEIVVAAEAAQPVAVAAAAVAGVARVARVDGLAEGAGRGADAAASPTADGSAISADHRLARLSVVLADAPDSAAALRTVEELRAAVHRVPGASALVGGSTAEKLDRRDTVDRDNRVVIPMILAVIFLVLVLLLRALVAPVVLLISVVLSYAAAMGAAGLVLTAMEHRRLWDGVPLQTFLFLVALGVDYTIFLITRAREETGRLGHRAGVLRSLTVTGGVITSAGVVLAATFGALCVLPLVGSVQTGVVIALGVLLDTFLVRSLLVPAASLDIGRRFWWPAHRRFAR